MKAESISDQKRLVRAEHWLFARSLLRARDAIHHAKWRLLTIAGPNPAEEIGCIKELMPKAHITAVDLSQQNLIAAIAAGADEIVHHDIFEFDRGPSTKRNCLTTVASNKLGDDLFDVVCLDLTGPASEALAQAVKVYSRSLSKGGILIATFSYGRDVVEFYNENWRRGRGLYPNLREEIENIGMPDAIRNRIFFLLGARINYIRSILQYRGGAMPMISILLKKHTYDPFQVKFKSIDPGDYERAVTSENLGNIYACPADRIEALRRSGIAKKAVATRKMRAVSVPVPLPEISHERLPLLEYSGAK